MWNEYMASYFLNLLDWHRSCPDKLSCAMLGSTDKTKHDSLIYGGPRTAPCTLWQNVLKIIGSWDTITDLLLGIGIWSGEKGLGVGWPGSKHLLLWLLPSVLFLFDISQCLIIISECLFLNLYHSAHSTGSWIIIFGSFHQVSVWN